MILFSLQFPSAFHLFIDSVCIFVNSRKIRPLTTRLRRTGNLIRRQSNELTVNLPDFERFIYLLFFIVEYEEEEDNNSLFGDSLNPGVMCI